MSSQQDLDPTAIATLLFESVKQSQSASGSPLLSTTTSVSAEEKFVFASKLLVSLAQSESAKNEALSEALLTHQGSHMKQKCNLIHLLIMKKQVQVLEVLLDIVSQAEGVSENVKSLKEKAFNAKTSAAGATPLHLLVSSFQGDQDVLKHVYELLRKHGASPLETDFDGMNVLQAACLNFKVPDDFVRFMLTEKGINQKALLTNNSMRGDSILHCCVIANRVSLANYFLDTFDEAKALLNYQAAGHSGFSPLHMAAYNGNLEMVALLQEKGADVLSKTIKQTEPHEETQEGLTAYEIAKIEGNEKVAGYLATFMPSGLSAILDKQIEARQSPSHTVVSAEETCL